MRERLRKTVISLKRRPQNIPLALLVISCMIYTFRLTAHSNASMYVSSRVITLYVFIITLTSILTVFSFINAYAKRQRRKGLMLATVYLLAGVQIVLDALYINIIRYETVIRVDSVPVTPDISTSYFWTMIHLLALLVSVLAVALLPLYRKLLLKINTTFVDDEESAVEGIDEKLVEDEEEWA